MKIKVRKEAVEDEGFDKIRNILRRTERVTTRDDALGPESSMGEGQNDDVGGL